MQTHPPLKTLLGVTLHKIAQHHQEMVILNAVQQFKYNSIAHSYLTQHSA